MSKTAQEYAEQCLGLQVPKSALTDTLAIFQDVPALRDQLSDPTFPLERKNDTSLTGFCPWPPGSC